MRSIASLCKPAKSIPADDLPLYIRAVEGAIEELKSSLLDYRKEYILAKLGEKADAKILCGA
jgi:hypothetical protein